MPRQLSEVVFVDGVRTPFVKAGDTGMYAQTRADDLVIKSIRELMRRNPSLPPERVDEVAIAATTQIGDQGLTLGRTAALLAALPLLPVEDAPTTLRIGAEFLHAHRAEVHLTTHPAAGRLVIPYDS